MPKSAGPSQNRSSETAIVRSLTKRKWTLAVAESCTGGFIAHRITNVPGASKVFLGGIIAYSNGAKGRFLGVRAGTLARLGAVSKAVAREMAGGARKKFGANFALAVTGIAGPGGGSKSKPVGTVFIALADEGGTVVVRESYPFGREKFKQAAATRALKMLHLRLMRA